MVRAEWVALVCIASVLWAAAAAAAAQEVADNESYTFLQWVRRGAGARRLFGGAPRAGGWGAVCAVQGAHREPSCTCAVVAPRWALTAAHCVPGAGFVHYNAEHAQRGGDSAAVAARYLHPRYHVTVHDAAGVPEVRELQHDVGLLRTATAMRLLHAPHPAPLDAIKMYPPDALINSKLEVLGFGKWEAGQAGESLRTATLTAVRCARAAWRACVCGAGAGGVCGGDSGGPALLGDALVALSSLGPAACAAPGADEDRAGPASVLTALQPYADMLEATVADDWSRPRMALQEAALPAARPAAGPPAPRPALLLAPLVLLSAAH